MNICTAPNRPYMVARNAGERHVVLFQPRCRSWQCPACANINVRLYALLASQGAQALSLQGHDVAFLTLTSNAKVRSDEGSRYIWRDAWPRLRKRAGREIGRAFDYQCVPERHEDGAWHWHLVTMPPLSERWWKDNAPEVGLGYMVDESIINSVVGVSWYIAKYLTKSLGTDWPVGWRRLRTSRTWPREKRTNPPGWSFEPVSPKTPLADFAAHERTNGYQVHMADHQGAWAWIETIDANQP